MQLKEKLTEVNAQIDAKREEAQDKWKAFDEQREEFAKSGEDANNTESEAFKAAEEKNRDYSKAAEELKDLEHVRDGIFRMLSDNGEAPKGDPEAERSQIPDAKSRETMGDRIAASDQYKAALESGVFNRSADTKFGNVALGKALDREEFKALITGASDTSGGAFVVNDRQGYYPKLDRPLLLTDLITVGQTDSDTVEFVKQTTQTHAAAETAEATSVADGAKPESTYAFELVTAAVRTIAHWVPATKRALRDAGQLRTIIDAQLRNGLEQRLETQMVAGNGTGENLRGILNTTGIGSQAKGTDSVPDAVHKAITIVRLAFQEPNGVALHPNDWQDIRLLRDDSGAAAGTGSYLFGPPSMAGAQQIWGLPVAVGAQFPDGTGLVGDFRQAILWLREGIQVLASDSHEDFFVKNLVAVLAEMAAAFGVVRPDGFCKVTGI